MEYILYSSKPWKFAVFLKIKKTHLSLLNKSYKQYVYENLDNFQVSFTTKHNFIYHYINHKSDICIRIWIGYKVISYFSL